MRIMSVKKKSYENNAFYHSKRRELSSVGMDNA